MVNYFDFIYEPEEDSYALLDCTLKFISDNRLDSKDMKVCEMGIGNGWTTLGLLKEFAGFEYTGIDVNQYALEYVSKKTSSVNLIKSDLFSKVNDSVKFDLILFNTPYLPCEDGEEYSDLSLKDRAIYGGKRGYEVIEKFIYEVGNRLTDNGSCIMVFSSLSNWKYIKEVLKGCLFEFEILRKKKEFFEDLYVVRIWKNSFLKKLNGEFGISSLKYFNSGKHSKIYSGILDGSDVVVKHGDEQHLQIEEMFLRKLKKRKDVVEMFVASNEFVVLEMINGRTIKEYLETEKDAAYVAKVLNNILDFTFYLDSLGVNKFELTNPYKHIFVLDDLSVKFIDFERCLYSDKVKNTTQILQYFRRMRNVLLNIGIELNIEKMGNYSKKYKSDRFKFKFEELIVKK